MSLVVVATLSACQTGNGVGGKAVNPGNQNEEPVELVFWSSSRADPAAFDEEIGNPLRAKFPNYKIEYIQRVPDQTDLSQLFAAGQEVDIVFETYVTFASSVVKNDLNYDMSELIQKHNVDLNRFEPSMIEAMRNLGDGKLYALPVSASVHALYFNKDLFDKFSVPYPTDGMTWDDLKDTAAKMTRSEGGQLYAGFAPSLNHLVILNPYSIALVDKKTNRSTYGDARWKRIIETELLPLVNSEAYRQFMVQENGGKVPGSKQFTDGKLAMLVRGNGAPNVPFDWDIVSQPHYKDLPEIGYQSLPTYYAVTKTAKNKDAAMEAIRYLTSDDHQLSLNQKGTMTVLKNPEIQKTFAQETEFKNKNWNAFFYNKFPHSSDKTVIEDLIKKRAYGSLTDRIHEVVMGNKDLNTALREAEEEVNRNIDEYLQR